MIEVESVGPGQEPYQITMNLKYKPQIEFNIVIKRSFNVRRRKGKNRKQRRKSIIIVTHRVFSWQEN